MTVTVRVAALVAAVLVLAACGTVATPVAVPAVVVDLPAGAEPEVLTESRGSVLVGFRRDGRPGLVRRATDGALTELPVHPSSGYGETAAWYALTADGDQLLAVGGDRGGAHGNVRWSVWTGRADSALDEHSQAFSTFGGWGAGELTGAVFTSAGPMVVGSWQSAAGGNDIAVWTATGDEWNRLPSAGTALASTRATQNIVNAATRAPGGVLAVGLQFADGGQVPAVWRYDGGQWTATPLPDGGTLGIALAASCGPVECAVAGRVDGLLALWRWADGRWARVAGMPRIAVGDRDPVAAPLLDGDRIVQVAADGGRVVAIDVTGSGITTRPIAAVAGPVQAAVAAGADAFVLAGAPVRLWRVQDLVRGRG